MKTISIVTPCFNEEENARELYERIQKTMEGMAFNYEHIFIDNASIDHTVEILRELAAQVLSTTSKATDFDLLMLSLNDAPQQTAGSQRYFRQLFGLDSSRIAQAVQKYLE